MCGAARACWSRGMLLRAPIGFSHARLRRRLPAASSGRTWAWWPSRCSTGSTTATCCWRCRCSSWPPNVMNAGTVSERLLRLLPHPGRAAARRAGAGRHPGQRDLLGHERQRHRRRRRPGAGDDPPDAARSPSTRPGFAGAVVVPARPSGPIIPPSIPMVIYALVSGTSVGALFLGGVVPGLLMALVLMIADAGHRDAAQDAARRAGAAGPQCRAIVLRGVAAAVAADRAAGRHLLRCVHADRGRRGRGAARPAAGRAGLPRADVAHAVRGAARFDALERGDHADHRRRVHAELRVHRRGRAAGARAPGSTACSCRASQFLLLVNVCSWCSAAFSTPR